MQIQILSKAPAQGLTKGAQEELGLELGCVCAGMIYQILGVEQLDSFIYEVLFDPMQHVVLQGAPEGFASYVVVAKQPGVTDDPGCSARLALERYSDQCVEVYSQEVYWIEAALNDMALKHLAHRSRLRIMK